MKYNINLSLFFISLFLVSAAMGQNQKKFEMPSQAKYIPGQVIVKLKPQPSGNRFSREDMPLLSPVVVNEVAPLFPSKKPIARTMQVDGQPEVDLSLLYTLSFDPAQDVEAAINLLWNEDKYEYIEPRYIYEVLHTPNDPTITSNLNSNTLTDINAYRAWDIVTGSAAVVTGFVDTGYWTGKTDMDQNITYNTADIPGNNIDDDGNGYKDDYAGWDFFQNDGDPNVGANTHGYTTSRIYGARTNNALQGVGVSYNCGHRNIRAGNNYTIMYGYEGVIYAVDNGCHVVNLSWGSEYYSAFGAEVIRYATLTKKAAVVAAAGNSSNEALYYPASYPNVISVAALGLNSVKTTPSTFNSEVDIAAPGWGDFTSNAAPVVAAAVALTYKRFRIDMGRTQFTPFMAAQRVRATALNIDAQNPTCRYKLGQGKLDLWRAVKDSILMPSVRVQDKQLVVETGPDNMLNGGETASIKLECINWLDPVSNLSIRIVPDDVTRQYLYMIDSVVQVSALGNLQAAKPSFRFALSSNSPKWLKLNFLVTYSSTNYVDYENIVFDANPNFINVENNQLKISFSGYGNVGNNVINEIGMSYKGKKASITGGSGLIVATASNRISTCTQNTAGFTDKDFVPLTGFEVNPAPKASDFEMSLTMSDSINPIKVGVQVAQKLYNYTHAKDDDYQILEYEIKNTNDSTIHNVYTGLYLDWDIQSNPNDPKSYTKNVCSYDINKKMVYANQVGYTDYFGAALLTGEDFHCRSSTKAANNLQDAGKFAAIKNNVTPASGTISTANDIIQYISAGPFDLAPGESRKVVFLLMAGKNLNELNGSRLSAIDNYFARIKGNVPLNIQDNIVETAGEEAKDAEGWTYYYSNKDKEKHLLFAIKKDYGVSILAEGVSIGYGGEKLYTQITAPYVDNPSGWYAANRYWNVNPTQQPTAPIKVRMYYTLEDYQALLSAASVGFPQTQMIFYKFTSASGINPDPLAGHEGATTQDFLILQPMINQIGGNGITYYAEMEVPGFSGGGLGITGDASIFPVILKDFTASATVDNRVALSWKTLSEMNSEYFEIQRSTDGFAYESVTTIKAAGNSTTTQFYRAMDNPQFKGTLYYRLKQVDVDGAYSLSNAVEVSLNQKVIFTYPNPSTDGVLNINCQDGIAETRTVQVYDINAKLMQTHVFQGQTATLDLHDLEPGYYMIQIYSENSNQTVKWLRE